MKYISTKLGLDAGIHEKKQDASIRTLRIVALFAIGLMIFGFADELLQTVSLSFPGPPTISIDQIAHTACSKMGLAMMSAGIILFALLPSLRVLLGISQFIHNHEVVNLIVATIVLLELTASVLLIFGMKGVQI